MITKHIMEVEKHYKLWNPGKEEFEMLCGVTCSSQWGWLKKYFIINKEIDGHEVAIYEPKKSADGPAMRKALRKKLATVCIGNNDIIIKDAVEFVQTVYMKYHVDNVFFAFFERYKQ